MIITFIFLCILINLYSKTISDNRRILFLVVAGIYFFISFMDLYWLANVEYRSFHLSDPAEYYNQIQDISFWDIFDIDSSNTFYYIINWIYKQTWESKMFISCLVKINNILILLTTYLLLTYVRESVDKYDFLLLLNPYTIMTMNRNVRDLYIILFVVVILCGFKLLNSKIEVSKFWVFLCIPLLFLTRAILFLPLIVIFCYNIRDRFSKNIQVFICLLFVVLAVIFRYKIIHVVGNQMISAMQYIGEDIEAFLPLLSGSLSITMLLTIIKRITIGTLSFLFTPHPINYISKWFENMNAIGTDGIYTGFDNFLISLGAIFNYLFVIPVVIAFFTNWRKINMNLLIFVVVYIFLYVVSYLGVTDIRNRNTAIFFIILGVLYVYPRIKVSFRDYAITGFLFCVLFLFSS